MLVRTLQYRRAARDLVAMGQFTHHVPIRAFGRLYFNVARKQRRTERTRCPKSKADHTLGVS